MVERERAIEFIRALEAKADEHWEILNKRGYTGDYSDKEFMDQYGFIYKDEYWDDWHEASDPRGAKKALKILFDIDDEEIHE